MISLLAAAVEVLAGVSKLDIAQPPDMGAVIRGLAKQFTSMAALVLTAVNSTVIDVSRLAYVSILLVGVLLWATHVHMRLGRDLIKGGIVLAVLSEIVFPVIGKI